MQEAESDDAAHAVFVFKVVSIFSIWLVGFVGGILPWYIRAQSLAHAAAMQEDKKELLLSTKSLGKNAQEVLLQRYETNRKDNVAKWAKGKAWMNCFSAGVFLAGGFLHLLHAAMENEGLKDWSIRDNGKYKFPYAEMFCTLGFLLVFAIEQIAHSVALSQQQADSWENGKGILHEDESCVHDSDMAPDLLRYRKTSSTAGWCENKNPVEIDAWDDESSHASSLFHAPKARHAHQLLPTKSSPAVAVILFVALSFHSILEGLGIGAQTNSAWSVFAAIILHKGIAAFALGNNLLLSPTVLQSKYVLAMFGFSLMSVLGIALGWFIATVAEGSEDTTAAGICLALASGTFIYVALMEVLPQAFATSNWVTSKLVALFAGYALFGAVAKWA